jgi:FimV-like protein
MELYQKRDYPGAIAGLQAALALDPAASAPRFFLGATELLTGDAAAGARDLQMVAAGSSPFAPEAQFDLAKAYLQQGNKAQAVDALRKLADGPGDFQAAARQLLDRISAVQ